MTSKIKCQYCGKQPFKNRERLAEHLRNALHKFMCDGCDKWFQKPIRRKMIGEFAFCPKCYKRESE